MTDYRFILSLTLRAPVLTQAGGALEFGYDAAMLRYHDQPVLPGSLVRGNLRHALKNFIAILNGETDSDKDLSKLYQDWFGPEAENEDSRLEVHNPGVWQEQRGRLDFDYFWKLAPGFAMLAGRDNHPRHRIEIDPKTGAVERGSLMVVEAALPQPAEVVFEGSIVLSGGTPEEAQEAARWLEKAANFLPSIGALKGVGFGRVLRAEVSTPERMSAMALTPTPNTVEIRNPLPLGEGRVREKSPADICGLPQRLETLALTPIPLPEGEGLHSTAWRRGLALAPDRPFCLARPHLANSNWFIGEEMITGGAVKALLAKRLDALGVDKTALDFDHWTVTHAVPGGSQPARGDAPPLSLAVYKTGKQRFLLDLALPERIDQMEKVWLMRRNENGEQREYAPAFPVDWKHEDEDFVREQWIRRGWTLPESPGRFLAVRTAIEPGKQHSAEHQLFSQDCVDPCGHLWYADIDLGHVAKDKRDEAFRALGDALAGGLRGLGKTKARVHACFLPDPLSPVESLPQARNIENNDKRYYIVNLQTPARMFRHPPETPDVRNMYEDYWREAGAGLFLLERYFARQSRIGGHYHWNRYLNNRVDQTYRCEWLTRAGSVFVLSIQPAQDQTARELLQKWLRYGLPQPEGGGNAEMNDWQCNPHLGANGFGEIRVNHPAHTELSVERLHPGEGDWI